jgi:hypothetical protein
MSLKPKSRQIPPKKTKPSATNVESNEEWLTKIIQHDAFAAFGRKKPSLVIFNMEVPARKDRTRILLPLLGTPEQVAEAQVIRQNFYDQEAILHQQVIKHRAVTTLMHDAVATAFDNLENRNSAEWWLRSSKTLRIRLQEVSLLGQIIVIADQYGAFPIRPRT